MNDNINKGKINDNINKEKINFQNIPIDQGFIDTQEAQKYLNIANPEKLNEIFEVKHFADVVNYVSASFDSYINLTNQMQKYIKKLIPEHQSMFEILGRHYVVLCDLFMSFISKVKSGITNIKRKCEAESYDDLPKHFNTIIQDENINKLLQISRYIQKSCIDFRIIIKSCKQYDDNLKSIIGGSLVLIVGLGSIIVGGILLAPLTCGISLSISIGLGIGAIIGGLIAVGSGITILILSKSTIKEIEKLLKIVDRMRINSSNISKALHNLESMKDNELIKKYILYDCNEILIMCDECLEMKLSLEE